MQAAWYCFIRAQSSTRPASSRVSMRKARKPLPSFWKRRSSWPLDDEVVGSPGSANRGGSTGRDLLPDSALVHELDSARAGVRRYVERQISEGRRAFRLPQGGQEAPRAERAPRAISNSPPGTSAGLVARTTSPETTASIPDNYNRSRSAVKGTACSRARPRGNVRPEPTVDGAIDARWAARSRAGAWAHPPPL